MRVLVKKIAVSFIFLLLISTQIVGQEEEPDFKTAYIVITKMHFSNDEVNFDEWKKAEKEYFEKVTSKNDLILHSGVYKHYLTPDSSEILFISVYDTWYDFEDSVEINNELIEKGWPDKATREAFFEKQNSFYKGGHSDEMYSTLPYFKNLEIEVGKPLLVYMRKNKVGKTGSGYGEYFENVILKNKYIKGFFTMKHFFGSDSDDAYEVGVYENLGDIENAFAENKRLSDVYWTDKDEKKAFFKELKKIFKNHGDYIYKTVPELAK